MKHVSYRSDLVLATLWAVLLMTALYARPLLPVDETRYLAVAWEMWLRGDFLVPHLNGEPYSHKPPLLFWGMHLGWGLFGVNEWWPRLIAPLFGFGSLLLIQRLGRMIWPETPNIGRIAAFIALGAIFWTAFTTVTMFDMLHTFFALLGLVGLVHAARGGVIFGFFFFGAAIGLGVLAKGPAILVHLLPAALAAPLWVPKLGFWDRWRGWYVGVVAGIVLGAAIAFAWALPAAAAGGEAFREAILWGQSAGRMVKSFAHERPVWWYAIVLPVMILPWLIWPRAWWAVADQFQNGLRDRGVRLCLIWFGAAFLVFSLISGKQPHYLLPEFPALALVLAWTLTECTKPSPIRWQSADYWVPAGFFGLLAALLLGAALFHLRPSWATSEGDLLAWPVLILIAAIIILGRVYRLLPVAALAGLSVVAVIVVHLVAEPLVKTAHNFRPLATKMKAWEDDGYTFVTFGKYRGEFHFAGRLTKPIAVVDGPVNLAKHLATKNKVKVFRTEKAIPPDLTPEAMQQFRGRKIVVWDSARLPNYFLAK